MNCEEIKQMILSALPESLVIVDSMDNVHFSAIVVSDDFNEKNLVKRQQAVYGSLGEHIHNGNIHALALKTFTQAEWGAENG